MEHAKSAARASTSVLSSTAIVLGWALLTALSANAKIPLPFTPVPITLQTGVVVLGAVLFGRLGVLAQVAYVLLGCVGLPFFAVKAPGIVPLLGVTGGYLAGFVPAAWLAARFVHGNYASLGFGARFARLFAISAAFFVPGVAVLTLSLGVDLTRGLELGLYPFVLGDVIKTLIVASTPAAFVRPRA